MVLSEDRNIILLFLFQVSFCYFYYSVFFQTDFVQTISWTGLIDFVHIFKINAYLFEVNVFKQCLHIHFLSEVIFVKRFLKGNFVG